MCTGNSDIQALAHIARDEICTNDTLVEATSSKLLLEDLVQQQ